MDKDKDFGNNIIRFDPSRKRVKEDAKKPDDGSTAELVIFPELRISSSRRIALGNREYEDKNQEELILEHLNVCTELNSVDMDLSKMIANAELLLGNLKLRIHSANISQDDIAFLKEYLPVAKKQKGLNAVLINSASVLQCSLHKRARYDDLPVYFQKDLESMKDAIEKTHEINARLRTNTSVDLLNSTFFDMREHILKDSEVELTDEMLYAFEASAEILRSRMQEVKLRSNLVEARLRERVKSLGIARNEVFSDKLLAVLEMKVNIKPVYRQLSKSDSILTSINRRIAHNIPLISKTLVNIQVYKLKMQLAVNKEWNKELLEMLNELGKINALIDSGPGNDTNPPSIA